ncbi:MAG: hypothetical protein JW939_05640 [Candidatus Thermoplasmatota archaeon]|nr:hypothetical protein [Candidatus Thermoplasmatota archaeon]
MGIQHVTEKDISLLSDGACRSLYMCPLSSRRELSGAATVSFMVLLLVMTILVPPNDPEAVRVGGIDTATRAEGVLVDEVPLGVVFPDLDPGYVIICPEEFKEEVAPLAVHRTMSGLPARVYTLGSIAGNYSGVDLEQKVHNFLRSLHDAYPSFKWLLIVGDSEHLMPRALWHYAYDRGQPFDNFYYSDVYYAGLDSDWDSDRDGRFGEYSMLGVIDGDIDWDIYVGRVPASTEEQASNYVNKLLRYEKNPPIGSWMKRFLDWASLMEPPNRDFDPYRYYDYKSNAYKVAKRVEANLPEHIELKALYDYPQLEGGNYSTTDGRDTLNRANMLADFNSGASMLNFVGQARYEAYALNDYGPPTGNGTSWAWNEPMRYSDHAVFTNGDMMPFLYASTCDTAKFFQTGYYEDKSLETWLTSASGGAIGLISSTGTSARGEEGTSSWGNWYLDEEFWKLFLLSGETRPGRTLFKLKERYEDKWLSPTMEVKETILGMIYAYILLGDPYVDIYTAPASRFMDASAIGTTFYNGNHTTRFRVHDRDGVPVPNPHVTIYNENIYMVLTGNPEGWVNATLDLGSSTSINLSLSGHNMVPAFYRYQVIPAISDVYISGSYDISPGNASICEEVLVALEVGNRGGMTAENVGFHVTYKGGNGDPTVPYVSYRLGSIEPDGVVKTSFNWTLRPGDHSFSIDMDSTSPEIDLLNNHLEIWFNNPGPHFEFSADSGTIRPYSTASPGTNLTIDLSVLNSGFVDAPLEVQLFLGDPGSNGTPLSSVFPLDIIEKDGWGNMTIPFTAPSGDGLLFIIMDPNDRYPPDFTDEPVRSLLRIDLPPRWSEAPSMAILEDSRDNILRLDSLVTDDDTLSRDLVFSIVLKGNMTARIDDRDESGKFLVCSPPPDWWGDEQILVSVSDGLSSELVSVNITVAPVNDPPFFLDAVQGIIELVTLEDEPFSFLLRGGDIDSGSLTFHYEGDRLSVDPATGSILWEPGQEDVGTNDFTLYIRDIEGARSSLLLRIVVIGIDDPPQYRDVPDVTLLAGDTWSFQLNVSDEEGAALAFSSNSSFVWVGEDGVLHVNGSQEFPGLNHIRVSISDGVNTIYILFNVSIIGEVPDGDEPESDIDIQAILGGTGIAIALISLLFLLFIFLRRSPADRQVVMELEGADAAYDGDMASLDGEEAVSSEDEG